MLESNNSTAKHSFIRMAKNLLLQNFRKRFRFNNCSNFQAEVTIALLYLQVDFPLGWMIVLERKVTKTFLTSQGSSSHRTRTVVKKSWCRSAKMTLKQRRSKRLVTDCCKSNYQFFLPDDYLPKKWKLILFCFLLIVLNCKLVCVLTRHYKK